MRGDEFSEWLERNVRSYAVRQNTRSMCRRVERDVRIDGEAVSLDREFLRDGGKRLLELLTYTSEDQAEGRPVKCGIVFSGKAIAYTGMQSIKTGAKRYLTQFCVDCPPPGVEDATPSATSAAVRAAAPAPMAAVPQVAPVTAMDGSGTTTLDFSATTFSVNFRV